MQGLATSATIHLRIGRIFSIRTLLHVGSSLVNRKIEMCVVMTKCFSALRLPPSPSNFGVHMFVIRSTGRPYEHMPTYTRANARTLVPQLVRSLVPGPCKIAQYLNWND